MAKPSITGVYAIIHIATQRTYVGSSINIKERWRAHASKLKLRTHENRLLQAAWVEFGADAFGWAVLETVSDRSQLLNCEQKWMDHYQSATIEKGFNIEPTAGSSLGIKHLPEFGAQVSARLKGHKQTDYQKQRVSEALKGNKHGQGAHYHGQLTEQDVVSIKHHLAAHERSDTIAEMFHVSKATILRIANRQIWWGVRIDAALEARIDARPRRSKRGRNWEAERVSKLL